MSGVVFSELKKFVDLKYGSSLWLQVLDGANLKGRVFYPTMFYPDEEFSNIVLQLTHVLAIDKKTFIESFAEFMVPDLLRMEIKQPAYEKE